MQICTVTFYLLFLFGIILFSFDILINSVHLLFIKLNVFTQSMYCVHKQYEDFFQSMF